MEGFTGISRPAQDRIPDLLLDRHGFARQRRLVEHGDAIHDRSIDRHHVAFADNEAIARLDRLEGNLLEPAVPLSEGATRYPGQQRRHLTVCATLGKALEILPARIHHCHHDRGEVFCKDKGCQHGKRRNDIQAHIAATQADEDLDQEDNENRDRGRNPNRASQMLPSGKVRCESEGQPGRGPYNENRSKNLPSIRLGSKPPGRTGQCRIIDHTLTVPGWTSDRARSRGHLRA